MRKWLTKFLAVFLAIAIFRQAMVLLRSNSVPETYETINEASVVPASLQIHHQPSPQLYKHQLNKNKHNNSTETILSFLRIDKTGSTSMMRFFENFSGLTSLVDAGERKGNRLILGCMFGNFSNHSKVDDGTKSVCSHQNIVGLEKQWQNVRQDYISNYRYQYFTIVREPYEWMRSYFYYKLPSVLAKKDTGTRAQNTIEQFQRMEASDFVGWMELKHLQYNESKRRSQFEFIDMDVDKAIRQIQGDSPAVIPVVHECFEGSLRYLNKLYSFPSGAVDEFLLSNFFHSRKSKYNKDQETDEERELRVKAKVWFADEYRFYDAAVSQFRNQLQTHRIDPFTLKSKCVL